MSKGHCDNVLIRSFEMMKQYYHDVTFLYNIIKRQQK